MCVYLLQFGDEIAIFNKDLKVVLLFDRSHAIVLSNDLKVVLLFDRSHARVLSKRLALA